MKTKIVIEALLAAGILLAVVTGCAERGTVSKSNDPGGDYSIGNSGTSSDLETYDVQEEKYVVKYYEKIIESEGKLVINSPQLNNDKLYLRAMDNDYAYFSPPGSPLTVVSLDRGDYSSFEKLMSYETDLEWGGNYNKKTYCGCFFSFPCNFIYGEEGLTMRVYVGKTGEQMKCICEKPSHYPTACAAELNDTEMVFLCWGAGENADVAEIYKYKIGEEQAQVIYTERLGEYSVNSNPLIACYNGEIYLIYSINASQVVIKSLNPDGKEVKSETVELPNNYAAMRISELTVTKNNYLIRFEPRGDSWTLYVPVMIDRNSKECYSGFKGGLGGRFNDSIIDGRYIIILKDYEDPCPMFNIFDDETAEFHLLKFWALRETKVLTAAVDCNGDVMLMVEDENGARSLVLYENIISLI